MNQTVTPPKFGIGASARRKEDPAFITGHGRYVADVTPPGTLHAALARSVMAHARIRISGLEAAREAPGVRLVLGPDDIAEYGHLPCVYLIRQEDGSKVQPTPRPLLEGSVVRHIGEPVAFIVAETERQAKDAAELIEIDYAPLETVTEAEAALADDAPLVWPERGTNLAFSFTHGEEAATEAVFAGAAKTARVKLVNNRVVSNYMEPRGCVAEFDAASGRFTLTAPTQGGHGMRRILAKDILKMPEDSIRVVTPDVGGGFGTKMFVYRELPLAMIAARAVGAPVKWVGDRAEHFVADAQGRDNIAEAELALDEDGRFLALRANILTNMGAYLHQFGPGIAHIGPTMLPGVYDIPTLFIRTRGAFTNTVPTDAYRGAGRPEAAYVIERLVDEAAAVTGLAPDEIRRRNFIRPEQMPYTTRTGRTYDTGEFAGHLARAQEVADWAGFAARAEASARAGKFRGIGLSTYIEICAFPGSERAELYLDTDGTVTLLIGTQSNGQGHATAYAQVVAEKLGLDYDRIRVIQGDTDAVKTGGGTGGSRSIPIGLPSVDVASRSLADKIRQIAADELEVSAEDVELVDGRALVIGTDRTIGLDAVAKAAGSREAVTGEGEVKQDGATYPNGTHVCEVEIDPDTGVIRILSYVVVDDFGVTVNPILLAGQVHGGIAQGIGQALGERTVYDADGQLITASFLDYAMPRAGDMPFFHFETRNVPSTSNALGIKGAGEAGTIGAGPAVMNAVVDALARGVGLRHIDMPATPLKVWEAIRAARG